MQSKWYTVRVATNKERFLNEKLKQDYNRRGLNIQTLIPMEKSYFLKAGKKAFRDKIIYPGYVFVSVDNLEVLQETLRLIPGNAGILRSRTGEPALLKQHEIEKMLSDVEKASTIDLQAFTLGEIVAIIGGPFDNFKGTIEEINKEKSKVKVNVSIFGRATPVDLTMDQIQKIID
jgi:transcriptional antiterminator NusG